MPLEFWKHPKFKPAALGLALVLVGILFGEQTEPLARVGLVGHVVVVPNEWGIIVGDVPGEWGNIRVLHQPVIVPEPAPDPLDPNTIPPPTPEPPVVGPPIDAPGLHVLMIEETGGRGSLPSAQLAAVTTTRIREMVETMGGDFLQLDDDTDVRYEPRYWREAMARPRMSLPWVIVSNGTTGAERPVESIQQVLDLIHEFQGM